MSYRHSKKLFVTNTGLSSQMGESGQVNEKRIDEKAIRQIWRGDCRNRRFFECRKVFERLAENARPILNPDALLFHSIGAGLGLETLQYRGCQFVVAGSIGEPIPPVSAFAG